ncbi:hypothetical protein JCM3774_003597 [Rhodotorula dairenensis]
MGRRKISIAPIKDERNRQVTFLKRKNGLFKKAYELGVLCSADVAIIVFNANGKLFEFHSGDMDQTLLRYSHYTGPAHEKRGPEDYLNQDLAAAASKRGSGMSDEAEDEEESDEEKPHIAAGSSGVKVISNAAKGKQALRAAAERKAKLGDRSRSLSEDHPHHQQHVPPLASSSTSSMYDNGSGAAELAAAANAASGGPRADAYQSLPSLNLNGFNFANGPMSAMTPQGGFPPNFTSAAPLAFPSFAATGLPVPNFAFALPGSAAWPNPFGTPTPTQSQQQGFPLLNGAGAPPPSSSSGGGVPTWFGAADPSNSATLQSARDQLAQLPPMQLLQQLGGMSAQLGVTGWPGLGNVNPEAAMQALQQQAQQAQHLFQQQQQQQQQQQSVPNGQQYAAHEASPQLQQTAPTATVHPHSDSSLRPTPAPMYGSPAASMAPTTGSSQPHQHPSVSYGVPPGLGGADIDRPGSSASVHSSHQSPARGRSIPPPVPGRQGSARQESSDSLGGYDRPRLQVAIPADARPNENTKPGLVTAGGASILGAGFSHRSSSLRGQRAADERVGGGGGGVDGQAVAEEQQQQHEVQRSAFASDLLPSPFYPNASYSTDGAFAWPAANTTSGIVASPESHADGLAPERHPRHSAAPPQSSQYGHEHGHAHDGGGSGRRESDESSGNGSNGLDDLSQAAQALSEGRHLGPGQRTHLRTEDQEGQSAHVDEAQGRGKRRKV